MPAEQLQALAKLNPQKLSDLEKLDTAKLNDAANAVTHVTDIEKRVQVLEKSGGGDTSALKDFVDKLNAKLKSAFEGCGGFKWDNIN